MEEPTRTTQLRHGLGPALTGVAGALLALWLLPATGSQLGPATVELSSQVGTGRSILQVNPFGTISARTHASPIDVTASLEQVDIEELGAKITTASGRRALQDEIESQMPGVLARVVVIDVLAAAVVGGLLGAAVFRHRRRAAPIAAVTAAVTTGLLFFATSQTYDQERFDNARYTGSLARARQVIETLTEHTTTLDEARSRYQVAARRVSELMILLAEPNVDPSTDTTAILHISDIHANPAGLEIAGELAREFDVSGVVDTGDLASSFLDTGEISSLAGPLDRLMVEGIEDLEVPYIFVPGNHDSPRLVAAVAGAGNATVLDGEVANVAGIEILGWGDPTYSTIPTPESEKAQERLEFTDDVAADVEVEQPDILAVHDGALAGDSAGLVPLVISGHIHRRERTEEDGTRFLAVGSTGATGLKSLTVEADLLYEAQVLYFDGDRLVAVDYLTLRGLGEDFTLERNTFAEEGSPAE